MQRWIRLIAASIAMAALATPNVEAQRGNTGARKPFRVFDNLYYIGDNTVSAWLVTTSEGLIMIDALFANSVDQALANIRTLGFDPADIRYLFVSHSHGDHAGGSARVKEVSGARVGMARADWDLYTAIPRDLAIEDGQSITLGDTTFRFYVTPGHTPGVLSMQFPVRDGGRTHTAFMFGGVGLNFSGVDRAEMYLASVRRLQKIQGVEANIGNHPTMGDIFARADKLSARGAADPHPFVAPTDFYTWLGQLEKNGLAKLEQERAAARQ